MDAELLERARSALANWQEGDLSALEPLLVPAVELLWWEPGDWDCHGREEVLALLSERKKQGLGDAEVELTEAGGYVLVVSRATTVRDGPQAGTRPATVVTFRDGKVISMRQFHSRKEALVAVKWRT
jgi:ketosteroid isomerase-like protein